MTSVSILGHGAHHYVTVTLQLFCCKLQRMGIVVQCAHDYLPVAFQLVCSVLKGKSIL